MKYFWYKKEILHKLNELGYVHFINNEKCDVDDFEEGTGFFCSDSDKTYGKAFITSKTVITTPIS